MRFLILLLLTFEAYGQASNPNDTLKIGNKNSASDKGLIFETNDGVSNKTLKVNPTSKALIFTGNDMQIGDGATGNDKSLVIDPASGAGFNWSGADSKLTFTNDGSTFKKIGSGSGGGGGENFNNGFTDDDNANAEDGLTGWTASAGTFALETTDPLEGEQSFNWTPAAQNDTLDSAVLDFDKDVLKGNACQANITYIGGDENLTLQVIDADNDVIAEEVLKAHATSSVESAFFICPSDGATANDLDLRLRILNAGASASPLIKFDKAYLGTLIGLSTVYPNMPPVMVSLSGNQTIPNATRTEITYDVVLKDDGGNFDLGNNHVILPFDGIYDISFRFASAHSPTEAGTDAQFAITLNGTPVTIERQDVDQRSGTYTTSLTLDLSAGDTIGASFLQNSGSSSIINNQNRMVVRQVQSNPVQVYKSIPKVSELVNEIGFTVGATGVIVNETVEGHGITVSKTGTGDFTVNFSSLNLGFTPVMHVNTLQSENYVATLLATSSTQAVIRTNRASDGARIDQPFSFTLRKTETDVARETVQPVIVGQVQNSSGKNINTEFGTGSCIASPSFSQKGDWVSSMTRITTGTCDVNFNVGFWSEIPRCFITPQTGGTNRSCRVITVDQSKFQYECVINNTGATSDVGVVFNCLGEAN